MRNTLLQPKARLYKCGTLVHYRVRRQFVKHSPTVNQRLYIDQCNPTAALYRLTEGLALIQACWGDNYPLRGKTITRANCLRPVQLTLNSDWR